LRVDSENVTAQGVPAHLCSNRQGRGDASTEIPNHLQEIVEDSCAFTAEMKSKDKMREDARYDCQ
jgi:hypothetical protein